MQVELEISRVTLGPPMGQRGHVVQFLVDVQTVVAR